MIHIGLERRVRNEYYERWIVNPYHIVCYNNIIYDKLINNAKTEIELQNSGNKYWVREGINEIARLVKIATTVSTKNLPKHVHYLTVENMDDFLKGVYDRIIDEPIV